MKSRIGAAALLVAIGAAALMVHDQRYRALGRDRRVI